MFFKCCIVIKILPWFYWRILFWERIYAVGAVGFWNNAKHYKIKDIVNIFCSKENPQLIIQDQQHPTFHAATKRENVYHVWVAFHEIHM